jgi:hypothetical protein
VRGPVSAFGASILLGFAATALACPVCDSGTGEAVRAGILADFGTHLLVTVAPFPVLVAVVALLHWGWPPWRFPS